MTDNIILIVLHDCLVHLLCIFAQIVCYCVAKAAVVQRLPTGIIATNNGYNDYYKDMLTIIGDIITTLCVKKTDP